jgi:hypothetical protein
MSPLGQKRERQKMARLSLTLLWINFLQAVV